MTGNDIAARLHAAVLTAPEELAELSRRGRGGSPPSPPPGDGGGGSRAHRRKEASATGILLALAAILMFFMALTSAFIVRKGTGDDWVKLDLPAILYLDTLALAASSVSLELARRARRQGQDDAFGKFWWGTILLGGLFLAGQLVAWRQLAAQGLYVSTNPGASFFYVLTAAHGAHLVGGLLGLLVVGGRMRRGAAAVDVVSVYWHFMGALWLYLLLLLRLGG